MTNTICRGGGITAFRVMGKTLDPRDQAFADALREQRFRTIENAASEEVSVGWVTVSDPTGDSFEVEDFDAGIDAAWLRFRMDKKTLPAKWMQIHRDAAEKARGKKLSAKERRELKDDVMDMLLPRVLPTVTLVDALFSKGKVLLFSTSKGSRDALALLWFSTFGSNLDPAGPRQLAAMVMGDTKANALDKAAPMRWPTHAGGQS